MLAEVHSQEAAASKEIVVLNGDRKLKFDRVCGVVEAFR